MILVIDLVDELKGRLVNKLIHKEYEDEIYLKYGIDETERELQLAKVYWTNPKDWGYRPKSEFN